MIEICLPFFSFVIWPQLHFSPLLRREIRFYCPSDSHANVKVLECSTERSRWIKTSPSLFLSLSLSRNMTSPHMVARIDLSLKSDGQGSEQREGKALRLCRHYMFSMLKLSWSFSSVYNVTPLAYNLWLYWLCFKVFLLPGISFFFYLLYCNIFLKTSFSFYYCISCRMQFKMVKTMGLMVTNSFLHHIWNSMETRKKVQGLAAQRTIGLPIFTCLNRSYTDQWWWFTVKSFKLQK